MIAHLALCLGGTSVVRHAILVTASLALFLSRGSIGREGIVCVSGVKVTGLSHVEVLRYSSDLISFEYVILFLFEHKLTLTSASAKGMPSWILS